MRFLYNANKVDLRCAMVVTIGDSVVVGGMIFGSSVVVGVMIFTSVSNENPKFDEGQRNNIATMRLAMITMMSSSCARR